MEVLSRPVQGGQGWSGEKATLKEPGSERAETTKTQINEGSRNGRLKGERSYERMYEQSKLHEQLRDQPVQKTNEKESRQEGVIKGLSLIHI